jgi:hypothetical protein
MNVPADVMAKLAHAVGAPGDSKAEGVVRIAIERLEGPREWHVEVLEQHDGGQTWTFHSFHTEAAEAHLVVAKCRRNFERQYRVVELLRRVVT